MQKLLKISILFFSLAIHSQELPPIQSFAPTDYKGENQNWGISQSNDKLIYIANNKGLLEFNGASWSLYDSPNESIMRSVNVVGDRIYTGCFMEFGYWKKNSTGCLDYTSLSKKIGFSLIEDEEFWNIIALGDLVVFQSLKRIYVYNIKEDTANVIDSDMTITKIFNVGETIYFQRLGLGVFKIEYGKDYLVIADDIVKNDEVINVFEDGQDLLILTQNEGFFRFANNSLVKTNFTSNELLSKVSFYDGVQLKNKDFVLGTIANGVICLNQNGDFKFQINQNIGLANNTVLSLFEDIENNIWFGLDNGISYLNTDGPYKVYNDSRGALGSIYATAVYKGTIYVGTNQGLFFRKINGNNTFNFIQGTQGQVWSLRIIDETLFCGHNSGTFIVSGESARKIANVQGTWDISSLDQHPNLLLQGNYDGLYVLEKRDDSWSLRNKIKGFNNSSRYFENVGDKIFVNHEYNGVFEMKVDSTLFQASDVAIDTTIKGSNSGILKYRGDLLYAYKEGVFTYQNKTNTFVKDTFLSKVYNEEEYESGKLILNDLDDVLWVFTKSNISFVIRDKLTNTPKIKRIPLAKDKRNGILGYENIARISDDNYLIGTTSGYITVDVNNLEVKDFQVQIGSIKSSSGNYENPKRIDVTIDGKFKTDENNISISFYTPEFNKYLKTTYQFQLEGIYDTWSNWTEEHSVTFENLPYGDYTFQVKGKIGDKISNNSAAFSFQIAKPWYFSNIMVALYLIGFVLCSLILHNIYKGYYKKQQQKLIEKNEYELELVQVQNEKEIIKVKNERLETEYRSKSKELAASTMSIIKKNELLTKIKDELKKVNDKDALKPVINIIDKSLKQNDDWELFQEAFNNADSEFLKKIKDTHPSLSPNDLKLCAYLRLNLSSKEVANLLSISPRSVEIKRYRLRKKLNLQHEENLVNYILNF